MSNPHTICKVCSGTEFTLDAGHYFCLECNTQSQDIIEQECDEWYKGANLLASARQVKKKSKEQPDEREKLTSWEVLNYVLKGFVDELIDLGAKPELKHTCLQLWATYLRQLGVAFMSTKVERKPKLGYSFKPSDAEIVYGVTKQQLKEKSWRARRSSGSKSDKSSESGNSQATSAHSRNVRLGFSKRALARAEYSNMSQRTAKSFSQTLDELDKASATEAAETPKKIRVTKHTRSLLSSSGASSNEDEQDTQRRIARREAQSVRNVTLAKVVALLNIALSLIGSEIQLSDFLRWVEEGHISLKQARRHLPPDVIVDYRVQQNIEYSHLSYAKCQGLVSGMCKQLGIYDLPPVDLCQLATRYCQELQLPDELAQMTRRLLGLMGDTKTHGEVEVMATIVVVMKLLFSLDDTTEFHLSHAAQEINRASTEAGDEAQEMFVWQDWQHLLECRKAVLAALNYPTRQAVYETSEIGRDPELFLQHTQHMNRNLPSRGQPLDKNAINKDFKDKVLEFLQDYIDKEEPLEVNKGNERIEFPASLTPLHSYTQYLLTRHNNRVQPVAHILERDFTKHSLQHVLDPDRCVARGLANDLNIVVKEGVAANFQVTSLSAKEKDSLVIPRYRLNQVKTTAKVVKSLEPSRGKQPKKHSDHLLTSEDDESENDEFQQNLKDLISEDSSEEESDSESEINHKLKTCLAVSDDTLTLYNTCSQYWFIHVCTGKNNLSLDEFNMLATKEFPTSFLWFLKECARTIKVHPRDLYVQVIQIEKQHKKLVKEAVNSPRTAKRKFSKI